MPVAPICIFDTAGLACRPVMAMPAKNSAATAAATIWPHASAGLWYLKLRILILGNSYNTHSMPNLVTFFSGALATQRSLQTKVKPVTATRRKRPNRIRRRTNLQQHPTSLITASESGVSVSVNEVPHARLNQICGCAPSWPTGALASCIISIDFTSNFRERPSVLVLTVQQPISVAEKARENQIACIKEN